MDGARGPGTAPLKILAIDPGTKLGWATNQTGRLEWGTENFSIKNGESSGNRWLRFGRWLELAAARPDVIGRVDLVIYERSVFMPKARAAAEIAAGFTTRLEEHCELHGIALEPVGASALKKFATGKGNADKEAMVRAAMIRADREKPCDPILNAVGLDEHQADALWLLWYALDREGSR